MSGAVEYLKNREETAWRLLDLRDAIDQATQDLMDGVAVARELGMTWQEIGSAFGITLQGARQRFRNVSTAGMPAARREEISKLLGVGERQPRFEVRVLVSGRPGVTKTEWAIVSRHVKAGRAIDQVAKVQRERGERATVVVWQVHPSGAETALSLFEVKKRARLEDSMKVANDANDF